MDDSENRQDGGSAPIDKATVKDALVEVLSKLPALKNLLMNPPSHLSDDQRNDRVGDVDKGKEGDKDKDPQCKRFFSVSYFYKAGLKHSLSDRTKQD